MTKRYLNRDTPKLGATGDWPRGMINDADEGGLNIAITRDGPIIRIEFGKPCAWIGMTPADAVNLARILLKHAGAKTVVINL